MAIAQDVRRRIELEEYDRLSPLAVKSAESKGRGRAEEPCSVRTCFQRDRDRIVHCKSFRRLKHKTQVFIAPQGDHYRTRLTHTLEVTQIARTIARALRLNEDLTEAIALGHDLGHTPFGHAGEEALDSVHAGGFRHNQQSLRVVDFLEKDGAGLNLSWEVRDGILCHSKVRDSIVPDAWGKAGTLEGQIVKLADTIAYINHDIDDAIRGEVISLTDLPSDTLRLLGSNHSDRINTMVHDVIAHSLRGTNPSHEHLVDPDSTQITMSPLVLQVTEDLRNFLFETVYIHFSDREETEKAKQLVRTLYEHFSQHPNQLPDELQRNPHHDPPERLVCDHIAGMTDRYALEVFAKLFMPRLWSV